MSGPVGRVCRGGEGGESRDGSPMSQPQGDTGHMGHSRLFLPSSPTTLLPAPPRSPSLAPRFCRRAGFLRPWSSSHPGQATSYPGCSIPERDKPKLPRAGPRHCQALGAQLRAWPASTLHPVSASPAASPCLGATSS